MALTGIFWVVNIIFPTKVNLENEGDLNSKSRSLTWAMVHGATAKAPLPCSCLFSKAISKRTNVIQTRAIEITLIFKIHFGLKKDMPGHVPDRIAIIYCP